MILCRMERVQVGRSELMLAGVCGVGVGETACNEPLSSVAATCERWSEREVERSDWRNLRTSWTEGEWGGKEVREGC